MVYVRAPNTWNAFYAAGMRRTMTGPRIEISAANLLPRSTTRCYGVDIPFFVHEFESVSRQQMWYGRKLRTVPVRIIVQFEERHSQ